MVRTILLVPFLLTGCLEVDGVGLPTVPSADSAEPASYFDWEERSECVYEQEPNADGDYEWLGLLENDNLKLCGTISSTGVNEEGTFTGDVDVIYFEVLQGRSVSLYVDWSGATEPDLIVVPPDGEVFYPEGDAFWSGWVDPGWTLMQLQGISGSGGSYSVIIYAD